MTEQRTNAAGEAVRNIVGWVLFLAWTILTVLWIASIVHALGEGEVAPLIMGIVAILLMLLLAVMEGLEVAVIDRWDQLYPDRAQSELAGWLAARQLFVALIVTTATILAEPRSVPLPFSNLTGIAEIPEGVWLKAFTIVWTTITVLWYMQILPKHMAATNPDRYLSRTRPIFFPVVQVVHHLGIAKPAETVAKIIEKRLDWHATEGVETGVELEGRRVPSGNLASAWAALIPESAPSSARRRRDDEAAGG
ncbi:hypothetical protein ACFPK1_12500 [Actinomycetospora rhizophila]|uniref:Uncharacterized protein n=1 Tax=Actinomycetospora rhizophila TaxID=1416876 RepID=A0ABV9ZCD1_9PSEU